MYIILTFKLLVYYFESMYNFVKYMVYNKCSVVN